MAAMKPAVRQDVVVVELDGEAVIYDESNGHIHHLNPTATIVFNLFDGTATVKELAGLIAGEYDIAAIDVERQIRSLIRDFRAAGLIANGN